MLPFTASGVLFGLATVFWLLCPIQVRNEFSGQRVAYFEYLKNTGDCPEIAILEKSDFFSYFVRPAEVSWSGGRLFNGRIPEATHAVELIIFARNKGESVGVLGRYLLPVDKDHQPLRLFQTSGAAVDLSSDSKPGTGGGPPVFRTSELGHREYEDLCKELGSNMATKGRDWFANPIRQTFEIREFAAIERVFFGNRSTPKNRIALLSAKN